MAINPSVPPLVAGPDSNATPRSTTPVVVTTKKGIRAGLSAARRQGRVIGLVPTMGYFHDGHLSLMRAARNDCDLVVVSIFVNPTQFGPDEDLEAYPRDTVRDKRLAAAEGVDIVFIPSVDEMYRTAHETTIAPGAVADTLCGSHRPGHFRGVATVVVKLLNIVGPDRVYFGQKDAQQAAVIKNVAADLDIAAIIKVCPTVRDHDGLALSSRNYYLNDVERGQAVVLYQALDTAREAVSAGETDAGRLMTAMKATVDEQPLLACEYADVVDTVTMQPLKTIEDEALAVVAARAGRARLIDNMLLKREE